MIELLLKELDRRLAEGPVRLAIEGGSASGKTTLGALLEERYGCTLLHMDDFFLRPLQRTPERLAEVGGNVDRERFLEEVLRPLSEGKTAHYRRYDCGSGTLLPAVEKTPGSLMVTEGAYSLHPELAEYYNFSVFLDVDKALQKERIRHRNTPEQAERFFNEWIPKEEAYFDQTAIRERCDLVIKIPCL